MENRVGFTGLAVFVLSLSFLLLGIEKPVYYVMDEVAYVTGARAFLTGTGYSNPEHPPLAKILIAGGMKLAGDNPFGWRLAGAVFGSLTLVAIFLWTYLLLDNYLLALLAAFLALLNNFLFVIARVAMLDVFYVTFVMWGLVAFTAVLTLDLSFGRRRILLLATGVMFGLGGACKWNTIVTLAAVALVVVFFYLRDSRHVRQIGFATLVVAVLLVPAVTYCLAFWIQCYRFHRPFTAAELVSMNMFIWRFHVNCPGPPALDSPWYRWIFRTSPERGMSYLLGNFVVVWGGFLALLICVWRFCRSLALPEGLVTLFYGVNLLQWVVIPQQRTMYYYYYPCTIFLCVAFAIVLGATRERRVLGMRPIVIILVLASVFFLYCYPRMAALEAPYDCALGCWN